MKAILEASMA